LSSEEEGALSLDGNSKREGEEDLVDCVQLEGFPGEKVGKRMAWVLMRLGGGWVEDERNRGDGDEEEEGGGGGGVCGLRGWGVCVGMDTTHTLSPHSSRSSDTCRMSRRRMFFCSFAFSFDVSATDR
jgi:hypothetical protein